MGGIQKLSKNCKIAKTYGQDNSLESPWGSLYDGTISFSIQPISEIFSKKPQSLSLKG
jgi:hypothetical protein